MRVVFATRDRELIGGLERYARSAMAALAETGVKVALLAEFAAPHDRESIDAGLGVPAWCVSEIGLSLALEAVREWRPDVVYAQWLENPALADALLEIAPAVYFAHVYHGVCISGDKMHKRPIAVPCDRRFGPECMLQYFPHRCGGLSPVTMWRDYAREMREHRRLSRYSAILTASEHMWAEYARVADRDRVHKIPMLVGKRNTLRRLPGLDRRGRRMLFAGRMTELKGGHVLLDSIPEVARALNVPLELTMAGEGRSRENWQHQADRLAAQLPGISIRFPGWLDDEQLAQEIARTDLLVMPSLWPEPFGMIGVEAASACIPSVAFDVGGISEWLLDGVSGVMADADPPTPAKLAAAIVKCLSDEDLYLRLSSGALENSRRFDTDAHVAALLAIFERVSNDSGVSMAQTA